MNWAYALEGTFSGSYRTHAAKLCRRVGVNPRMYSFSEVDVDNVSTMLMSDLFSKAGTMERGMSDASSLVEPARLNANQIYWALWYRKAFPGSTVFESAFASSCFKV